MADNPSEPPSKRQCLGTDCENDAGSLQCPTCLKIGVTDSYFCSQDCFKRSWNEHKTLHKTAKDKPQVATGPHNPFPTYAFTGSVRPVYPLSARRAVPKSIKHPDWAKTGIPRGEQRLHSTKIDILDAKGQEAMRKVCRLAREVLDITAAELKPGITTDYLDEICHNACVERNSYPSPLNYNHFPKSLCTSPNEVVCHGIPDHRILLDGDILNLDISLYHGGYHADLNETYYIGDRAKADPDSVRVVETARECLDKAIELVRPGRPIREFGHVIEKHAKSRNCSVVATWGGHGINTEFHPPPWIPHYSKNRAVGVCRPGMTFTIEPILTLGKPREVHWPDKWTNVTVDGKRTAQFEHTLLVTETGVEVLTAGNENSPGGAIPMPTTSTKEK
ncbi:methionine aminopeptidase 1 [Dothidotthia symphoricarpi CBS 119687]|uniref:Methionine aminopeptidase n=1 Tax=Dothidotthia symphoricarpi CBS 119687 TaxID=1392245 RepID=A0A6A6ADZ2_9PLEO|nr:methionine aminopeptidase 1 [Dothidotthia symphoricarpi CBS 119687]KAF2129117.1 methionine aminopeptidase 1 [Dothidotthia symphoricarpi CBS 119687]